MNNYYFELTDTFGGESNYSWVQRHKITANSLHGALIKLSNFTCLNFRFDGNRYNAKGACICAFLLDDESVQYYQFNEVQ